MASADLTGLVLPPPLDGESAEGLEALVEAGGAEQPTGSALRSGRR